MDHPPVAVGPQAAFCRRAPPFFSAGRSPGGGARPTAGQ
jgi:hypothetical protein